MARQPDYFEITYQAPFRGVHSTLPENKLPRASAELGSPFSPNISNFLLKNGEIRSRFPFSPLVPCPVGQTPTGVYAFVDSNGVSHTLLATVTGLYQLNKQWPQNPSKAWNSLGNFNTGNSYAPAQFVTFLYKTYFTNGGQYIWQWDGITSPTSANQNAFSPVSKYDTTHNLYFGAYFLGELNYQVIALSTVEQQIGGGVQYNPWQVRWSGSGNPTHWDPTVDTTAGYNPLLDVPDSITGFITIGRSGYIFRVNGITEMIPVTNGVLPFDFNHLWASDRGIGNVYPYTVAAYGPIGIFVSNEDIYQISTSSFDRIGAENRDAVIADLANATSNPIATILPNFGQTIPYVFYWLTIPMAGNVTKIWVYSTEDKSWTAWTEESGVIVGKMRLCVTG